MKLASKQAGFTLVELLIAISIFAVMTAMAYGGLSDILDTQSLMNERTARLKEIQKSFAIIERDMMQIVDRPVRDAYGDRQPAVTSEEGGVEVIEFSHTGWSNPMERPRSDIQRVAYLFEDGKVHRQVWWVLDRAQDSEPTSALLLQKAERVSIRFLDDSNEWQTSWTEERSPALPRAVELTIELEDIGRITRLFPIVGSAS